MQQPTGVRYLQGTDTGQDSTSSHDQSGTGSGSAPSKSDVREAHPEKIQEFLRDKYKSDPNEFPDVAKDGP